MSEYTTRQILDMIEANGGPEGLDLSGKYLSEIDLGRETIQSELDKVLEEAPGAEPHWWSQGHASIHLRGAHLERACLASAHLEGADLIGAHLEGAVLTDIHLEDADLMGAHLEGADLVNAHLEGADLTGATVEGAVLTDIHLERSVLGVNLRGADLEGAHLEEAKLWTANLEGIDCIMGTNLEGANLWNANLTRVDLRDTRSIKGAFFYRALLDHTQFTKEQLGEAIGEELEHKWTEAKEAYLALKNNFEQLGRYSDANWAYRKERRMEKRETWQKATEAFRERYWRDAIGSGLEAASDQFVELVCDYGEGIWRVVGTLLFLWLVFALSYGIIAGVWGPWQETSTGEIRYITRNPIDLLSFSLGAITTLVPADLEARSTLAMRVLMPLQAMFGIVLAGLLGFVLGNRIRRS